VTTFFKNSLWLGVGLCLCLVLQQLVAPHIYPYWLSILIYSGINITLAVSLNLINGMTGQFSIGHAGFMAVGAYVSSILSVFYFAKIRILGIPEDWSASLFFAVSLVAGGLVAAFLGYCVGLPSLRLKGDYLAIVTLGFGEIIRVVFLNMDAIGAARGLPGIPQLSSFGSVYAIAFLCVFFCYRLKHSPKGRALLAIREDEMAAQIMGVNTTRGKVFAFSVGAFFAGIAGGLFAHHLAYINPKIFDFNKSFEIIIMVVLGGMGSITGATLAAVFLTFLREVLRPLQELTGMDLRMVIYAIILIVVMIKRPQGLMGLREWSDWRFGGKKQK